MLKIAKEEASAGEGAVSDHEPMNPWRCSRKAGGWVFGQEHCLWLAGTMYCSLAWQLLVQSVPAG